MQVLTCWQLEPQAVAVSLYGWLMTVYGWLLARCLWRLAGYPRRTNYHHHHHIRLFEVVKRNRQHTIQKIDVGIYMDIHTIHAG